MIREDRATSSLRPLSIIVESLDRADGSAAFAFGKTKAIVSVSGPIQVRLAAELPSKATFEVIVRPLSGIPGTESKALGSNLRSLLAPSLVLTQNPRTLIQLVVQFLETYTHSPGPSLMAAAVNASSLALMRTASFPMLGVVTAASVGRVKKSDALASDDHKRRVLLLDPTEDESEHCDATGWVAVMFGSSKWDGNNDDVREDQGEVVWSSFQGSHIHTDYDALLRLAKSGAHSVYQAIRQEMEAKAEDSLERSEKKAKKIPRHKGGRVALNIGAEDGMDMT